MPVEWCYRALDEVFPVHSLMAYGGSSCTVPLILSLDCSRRYVANIRPVPLNLQKEPRCLLNKRLGGPQGKSGLLREEKNPFSLLEFEPRTVQPIAVSILPTLSCLPVEVCLQHENIFRLTQ